MEDNDLIVFKVTYIKMKDVGWTIKINNRQIDGMSGPKLLMSI